MAPKKLLKKTRIKIVAIICKVTSEDLSESGGFCHQSEYVNVWEERGRWNIRNWQKIV